MSPLKLITWSVLAAGGGGGAGVIGDGVGAEGVGAEGVGTAAEQSGALALACVQAHFSSDHVWLGP